MLGVAIAITLSIMEGSNSLLMVLIGVAFIAAGAVTYRQGNTQVIINRDTGDTFLRSWRPTVPLDTRNLYQQLRAEDIVAVQTASRTIESASTRGKATSYTQYQVNLCTSDCERYNAFVTTRQARADDLANHVVRILDLEATSLPSPT